MLQQILSWKDNLLQLPIEVFIRHCHYSTVSAHKERFDAFTKQRCLENFLKSIEGEKSLNVTFFLDTFHPMEGTHFIREQKKYPIIECHAGAEAASFLFMLEYVYKKRYSPDTIIYFLEDDYLHLPRWPRLLREVLVLPGVDYATLYDHRDKYFFPEYANMPLKLFYTTSCHWRTTPSTTNTYAMLFKTLKKHIDIHRAYSLDRTVTADHDKFVRLMQQEAVLVSSIPGYATHAEPKYASPCTDWQKLFK